MKRFLSLQSLLSLAFAVGITCFFALLYPHHLHFQEQYQLFQFDWNYACDVISIPGGVSEWLGQFCVQFFLFAWPGASIVALILTVIQRLTAQQLHENSLYALSFIPALLLFFFLFDENSRFGAVCAVLLSQLIAWGLAKVRPLWLQLTLFFVLLLPVYWAVGPIAILFVLLSFYKLLPALHQQKGTLYGIMVCVIALIMVVTIPAVAHNVVNYHLVSLYYGIHYQTDWQQISTFLWSSVGVLSLLPLTKWMFRKPLVKKSAMLCSVSAYTLTIALFCWLFQANYNPHREEVMKYDFMARFQQWNRIYSTAKAKTPNNPLSVTALNLALGMQGQLSEQMFEFRQNMLAGLLPDFVRDPVSPLTTAEAYYQLGMINTAQRYVFEAQEAIADFQKSARCYKRLAETNLIRGSYEVARKYLLVLQKTLFYRSWANETMALLGDEVAINNHPEYGKLRSYIVDQDFFYGEKGQSQMLGKLFMANTHNRLAYEYLQASYLLTGNLKSFVQYLDLGQKFYKTLPKHYQEAYLLWWSQSHNPNEEVPSLITPVYVQGLKQYISIASTPGVTQAALARQYGRTYWHYFFINNQSAQ